MQDEMKFLAKVAAKKSRAGESHTLTPVLFCYVYASRPSPMTHDAFPPCESDGFPTVYGPR